MSLKVKKEKKSEKIYIGKNLYNELCNKYTKEKINTILFDNECNQKLFKSIIISGKRLLKIKGLDNIDNLISKKHRAEINKKINKDRFIKKREELDFL